MLNRLGLSQNNGPRRIKNVKELIQLENVLNEDEGSKIENKFLIMIIVFCIF